jgi:hypothetical protein
MDMILIVGWMVVGAMVGMALGDLGGKRNGPMGGLLGGLMGPIGWIITLLLPQAEPRKGPAVTRQTWLLLAVAASVPLILYGIYDLVVSR